MSDQHLMLLRPRGTWRATVTIPTDRLGYLVRAGLACDLLPAGTHAVERSDRVLAFPANPFPVPLSFRGEGLVATVAVRRATFHGTDLHEHCCNHDADEPIELGPSLAAFLARCDASEPAHRLGQCNRLAAGIGLEVLAIEAVPLAPPPMTGPGTPEPSAPTTAAENPPQDCPDPSPETAPSSLADDEEADLLIRLGFRPRSGRAWWRGESLASFERRLFQRAARHLATTVSTLERARSAGVLPRQAVLATCDLGAALQTRLESQPPVGDLGGRQPDRQRVASESGRLLELSELLATREQPTTLAGLQAIDQLLEELRRCLDRRTQAIFALPTGETP